jgi:nitronate monooxygenase
MLKTPLCDLFGIEVPIILAPMGTCTSAELAAAVSKEGGLGGIGSLFRATAAIKRDIDTVRISRAGRSRSITFPRRSTWRHSATPSRRGRR